MQTKPYVTTRTGIVCDWRGAVECVFLCFNVVSKMCFLAHSLTHFYINFNFLLNLSSWIICCLRVAFFGRFMFYVFCFQSRICKVNIVNLKCVNTSRAHFTVEGCILLLKIYFCYGRRRYFPPS